MPKRGLIQKKLWGRSLWGLLAAVGLMFLAAYSWRRFFFIGFSASKLIATPYYAEYVARTRYEEWSWAGLTLVSLILSAYLLGVGVRPAPRPRTAVSSLSPDDARRNQQTLFDDLFDRVYLHRRFLGRLALAALVTFLILLVGLLVAVLHAFHFR